MHLSDLEYEESSNGSSPQKRPFHQQWNLYAQNPNSGVIYSVPLKRLELRF